MQKYYKNITKKVPEVLATSKALPIKPSLACPVSKTKRKPRSGEGISSVAPKSGTSLSTRGHQIDVFAVCLELFASRFCDQEHYNDNGLDLGSFPSTFFLSLGLFSLRLVYWQLKYYLVNCYASIRKEEDVRSKLNEFLRYLQIEKGFSPGTIEAYRLDIERGLIPFLCQQGKFEV